MNWLRRFVQDLREAIHGLAEAIAYAYPVFALQLFVFVLHRSWTTAILAVLALVFSFAQFLALYGECSRLRLKLAESFIKSFPNSQFESVGRDQIDKAELVDFKRLRLFVVRRAGEDKCASQLVSFNAFFGSSFIFLRDSPCDLSVYDRFTLFHEVAHASKMGKSDLSVEVARRAWVWQLAWIALFAQWNHKTVVALGLVIITQVVFRYQWSLWPESFSTLALRSEIVADRLALRHLTDDQLTELEADFLECPILDPRLSRSPAHRGNEFRNFMLLREIASILKKGREEHPRDLQDLSDGTIWKNLFSLAAIAVLGQSVVPWKLWTASAAVAFFIISARMCVRGALRMEALCDWRIRNQVFRRNDEAREANL